jgi:hypothetical protein
MGKSSINRCGWLNSSCFLHLYKHLNHSRVPRSILQAHSNISSFLAIRERKKTGHDISSNNGYLLLHITPTPVNIFYLICIEVVHLILHSPIPFTRLEELIGIRRIADLAMRAVDGPSKSWCVRKWLTATKQEGVLHSGT